MKKIQQGVERRQSAPMKGDIMPILEPMEFDSEICAAVAHDLAILQLPAADRDDLNFSVADLETLVEIAKGEFVLGENHGLANDTEIIPRGRPD